MDRRTVLKAIATLGYTGGVSGCLSGTRGESGQQTPTPVDLSGQKLDDRGGMVIGDHGGPNGQIFYRSHTPDGHDNPAWFHTLTFGLFPYYFEHKRAGWTAEAIYVTDYSTVEYTLSEGAGDRTVISAPTAAETFGDATEMTYVMESEVSGGMGPALLPFSVVDDADSFIDDHGGQRITFGEITPERIAKYTQP
ncbi:MAG: nitrous oxide reductase accessory protein NosL [Halobacteriales archaeon]